MKTQDLVEHKAQLNARLDALDVERAQLMRKIKAIDILLEGEQEGSSTDGQGAGLEQLTAQPQVAQVPRRKRAALPHAVRMSSRSSLIDAVHQVALKQPGQFDSVQLLQALQGEYPEFGLTETKHISSPLSDLVKRGALIVERKRVGNIPNIYRAVASGAQTS